MGNCEVRYGAAFGIVVGLLVGLGNDWSVALRAGVAAGILGAIVTHIVVLLEREDR